MSGYKAHRVTYQIGLRRLYNHEASIEAFPVETVLEATEQVGVDIPYGCRTGAYLPASDNAPLEM
jgi:ferredoxin